MNFEQEIDNLIASLPEMAAQAMENAKHEMAQNPPPEIKRLREEVKYLKVVDAVFTGKKGADE